MALGPQDHGGGDYQWEIFPELFGGVRFSWPTIDLFGHQVPSKPMLLQLLAAGLILAVFVPVCRRLRTGQPPRGRWQNAVEFLLTFIRDNVARPNIGDREADRYLPFLWTLFFFILFMNLLGMVPFMGSPTENIWVTVALAFCTFMMIHFSAIAKMGLVHYLKSLWPHLDIPIPVFGFILKLGICVIEIFGMIIKCGVLAVRLFANIFAGHMVLGVILLFIAAAANQSLLLWGTVTFASVVGLVALSALELFVACLQAFIFVFLASLFLGMQLHPAH